MTEPVQSQVHLERLPCVGLPMRRKGSDGPWLLLTSEAAMDDSPAFRAALHQAEDEIDGAGRWLESFVKNLRNALELSIKLTDFMGSLEDNLAALQDLRFMSTEHARLVVASTSVMTILQSTERILVKLIRRLEQRMVGPLLQNMLESVRELKEFKKGYERMVDKYDGYLAKPDRSKEPAIREEAYLADTLDYLARMRQFRVTFELGLLEKVSIGMGGFGEFCWTLGQLFRSLESDFDELKVLLPKWQEEEEVRLAGLKTVPRRPNGISQLEAVKQGRKRGYLYKRSSRSLTKGGWRRTYAELDGAHFTLSGLGRRGSVQIVARINVLLCEARPVEVADRRNCLEIYTSQKAWILCCPEGEDELREWLKAFEAAKAHALQEGNATADAAGADAAPTEEDYYADEEQLDEVQTTEYETEAEAAGKNYLLARENALLHRTVSNLSDTDLVLSIFCGLLKASCEQYLAGRFFITQQALYLLPASLVVALGSRVAVMMRFEDIEGLEPLPLGDNLLASMLIKFKPDAQLDHPSLRGLSAVSLLTIEQGSLDILARLYRNSTLSRPKNTQELVSELNLSTIPPSNSPEMAANLSSGVLSTAEDDASAAESVSCGCEKHLEHMELNMIFPVSVETMFDMLFGQGSGTLTRIYSTLKYTEPECGDWTSATVTSGDSGAVERLERDVKYVVPISNPLVKAKGTPCYERNVQTVVEPGLRYIIDTEARTPQVPYGDTFITKSRCCLTKAGKDRCRLVMSAGMHWIKSPLVKSIIRDATIKGFSRYCQAMVAALKEEIAKARPDLKDVPIVVEEEKMPLDQPAEGNMVFRLVHESGAFAMRVLKRYPIITIFTVLYALTALSWSLSQRTYRALFLRPEYVLVEPQAEFLQHMDRPEWAVPAYSDAFRSLADKDHELRSLGDDMVRLARDLVRMRAILGKLQYATWMADRLTECYQEHLAGSQECAMLEGLWGDSYTDANDIIAKF